MCVCASTFISVKQNKQVYLYSTLAKALFIHRASQTINFVDFSLAQFNVQSQQQQQKVSTIHKYSQTTICTFISNLPSILSAAQICHHFTNTKLAMYLPHLTTQASEFLGLSNATYTCPYHHLSHKPPQYPLLQATVKISYNLNIE